MGRRALAIVRTRRRAVIPIDFDSDGGSVGRPVRACTGRWSRWLRDSGGGKGHTATGEPGEGRKNAQRLDSQKLRVDSRTPYPECFPLC